MSPYKSPVARAVPKNPEIRFEIAQAIQTLAQDRSEPLRRRQAEIASLRHDLEAIRQTIVKLRRDALALATAELRRNAQALVLSDLRKYGYNPQELRVPAGSRDAGQWTSDEVQFASSIADDTQQILRPRGGHHFVPTAVYDKLPLKPETRQVFDNARTGSLSAAPHGWSKEHAIYNQAVAEALKQFLDRNGIKPEDMTPEQAEQFIFEVIGSSDPRIRDFNLKLYRREILQYILRHVPFIGGRGGSGDE